MPQRPPLPPAGDSTLARIRAYSVHLLTASGAGIALLSLAAILRDDYRAAFLWMAAAVAIDAFDGTLARRAHVVTVCPEIDGRKLDDIVDYLNFTFVPVVMCWHSPWLPPPTWLWASVPLMASLFGFAHSGAKEEDAGFFRGFPSYWNVVVFYIAVWLHAYGPYFILALVLSLSVLTVLPVRFVYPTRPPRWTPLFFGGGIAWLVLMVIMFCQFPDVSRWLLVLSGVYPALYVVLSVYLDVRQRRGAR